MVLTPDDLKEIGVTSAGHRLKILKKVYQVKRYQNVPFGTHDYIPESK